MSNKQFQVLEAAGSVLFEAEGELGGENQSANGHAFAQSLTIHRS